MRRCFESQAAVTEERGLRNVRDWAWAYHAVASVVKAHERVVRASEACAEWLLECHLLRFSAVRGTWVRARVAACYLKATWLSGTSAEFERSSVSQEQLHQYRLRIPLAAMLGGFLAWPRPQGPVLHEPLRISTSIGIVGRWWMRSWQLDIFGQQKVKRRHFLLELVPAL